MTDRPVDYKEVSTPENVVSYYKGYNILNYRHIDRIFDASLRARLYAGFAYQVLTSGSGANNKGLAVPENVLDDYLRCRVPFIGRAELPRLTPHSTARYSNLQCRVSSTVEDATRGSLKEFGIAARMDTADIIGFGGTWSLLPPSINDAERIIGKVSEENNPQSKISTIFSRSCKWTTDICHIEELRVTGLRLILVPRIVFPNVFDVPSRRMLHIAFYKQHCDGWYSANTARRLSRENSRSVFSYACDDRETAKEMMFIACTALMSIVNEEKHMQRDVYLKDILLGLHVSKDVGALCARFCIDRDALVSECKRMLEKIPGLKDKRPCNLQDVSGAVELRAVTLFSREPLVGSSIFAVRPVAPSWNMSVDVDLSLYDDSHSSHYENFTGWALGINISGVHLIHLGNPSRPVSTIPLSKIFQWGMNLVGMVVLKLSPRTVRTNEDIPDGEQISFEMDPRDAKSFCALLMEHIEVVLNASRLCSLDSDDEHNSGEGSNNDSEGNIEDGDDNDNVDNETIDNVQAAMGSSFSEWLDRVMSPLTKYDSIPTTSS